ncbi:MFS transporter [Pseudoduganella ginsengisoli]|uniref:MFS transporter n=1 Tax=Pseudoduganella ginsengisoli TaxID=1462440 RepID=A0A6L6PWI6_9BURK|nr:MFS transporter [Pseudoduganella ginsengisoli]MTW01524.1 MFS transporter [Pseudoduganella ginsengisoli]
MHFRRINLAILACTQIMSWGALYYAIAILAPAMARDLGWRSETVIGAFSWSLLVSGAAATPVGMLIDKHGGRWVMGAGSLLCGAGFAALSQVHTVAAYYAAWTVLGLAMAMTMYEAAFATINREFGMQSRQAISTLTLFGGFASTVSWPLTQHLLGASGWRDTWLIYGVAHWLVCLPLHLLLQKGERLPAAAPATGAAAAQDGPRDHTLAEAVRHPAFWKLGFAFSANSFIFAALSVHLIPLLQTYGHAAGVAVALAALVGPMQVAGRIGEMTVGRRAKPQTVGKITFGALPAALVALLLFGRHGWAAAAFCLLYGMSNGILTIVRGTIPQTLFGRRHYGAISGALAGPSLLSRAAGPLAVVALAQASSPANLLLVLLAAALASLACYLLAIRA